MVIQHVLILLFHRGGNIAGFGAKKEQAGVVFFSVDTETGQVKDTIKEEHLHRA